MPLLLAEARTEQPDPALLENAGFDLRQAVSEYEFLRDGDPQQVVRVYAQDVPPRPHWKSRGRRMYCS